MLHGSRQKRSLVDHHSSHKHFTAQVVVYCILGAHDHFGAQFSDDLLIEIELRAEGASS